MMDCDDRIERLETQVALLIARLDGVEVLAKPDTRVGTLGSARSAIDKPIMHSLWRDYPKTREGKYLVQRRDGTIPVWPHFVLGARDPCAPAALRAYATQALGRGLDPGYAEAVHRLADEFETYRFAYGDGDPDRGPHRVDDPDTIAKMQKGKSV